jgi:hypothetical protein
MKREYQKPILSKREQLSRIAALCPTSDPCVSG